MATETIPETSLETVDTTIIGAGVVGLAVANELASPGKTTVILEEQESFGSQISARNSEVIHAGIYYPPDSLKAKLCVEGKNRLYSYCESRKVPHQRIGKVITASTTEELASLDNILANAKASGVLDLVELTANVVKSLEPNIVSAGGLFSPSTGIVDIHQFMLSLLGDAEKKGASLAVKTKVTGIRKRQSGLFEITAQMEGETYQFLSQHVINAAGLQAQTVAKAIDGFPTAAIPKLHYCKGVYFSLTGKSPFSHLVYPVPEKNNVGLGVHATLDLGGQVKFGPDTEYVDEINFDVDVSKTDNFVAAVQRYCPDITKDKVNPHFGSIRPKLQGPNDTFKDFDIREETDNGMPGLVQLFGIESPGLTSSMAIANYVAQLLT